jgi:hypothetical protein
LACLADARRLRAPAGAIQENAFMAEATVSNQKQILANQKKILANQQRIQNNQKKILANQKRILSKLS